MRPPGGVSPSTTPGHHPLAVLETAGKEGTTGLMFRAPSLKLLVHVGRTEVASLCRRTGLVHLALLVVRLEWKVLSEGQLDSDQKSLRLVFPDV